MQARAPDPPDLDALRHAIRSEGHVFAHGARMRDLIGAHGPLADWPAFVASWNDLSPDPYLVEGRRFRRRRHGVFTLTAAGTLRREPHQPHFQGRDYNVLYGGIERWFEPLADATATGRSLASVLAFCHALFAPSWRVEVHQFRIEARAGAPGEPTPEGVHRDGVDHVLVLLVRRENIASGTTTIHAPDGRALGSFTLTHPFDAALIDDARVHHGVTPVTPLDEARPAYRDVLVVTLRRETRAATA
jgi:hypothetical protein